MDVEDESHWTDEDKELIGPSVNLIKAAKVSSKITIISMFLSFIDFM